MDAGPRLDLVDLKLLTTAITQFVEVFDRSSACSLRRNDALRDTDRGQAGFDDETNIVMI